MPHKIKDYCHGYVKTCAILARKFWILRSLILLLNSVLLFICCVWFDATILKRSLKVSVVKCLGKFVLFITNSEKSMSGVTRVSTSQGLELIKHLRFVCIDVASG